MKKLIICFLSIFLFLIVFYIADFTVFTVCKNINKAPVKYPFIKHSFDSEKFFSSLEFQKPKGLQYQKKPIVIFGEGMIYGFDLDEDANFSHFLSEITKRPVYNRARPGIYLQHALLQIENHLTDDMIKQSEYAITIVPSSADTWRLKVYPGPIIAINDLCQNYNYPKYVGKTPDELHLVKGKIPFITSSTIYRLLEKRITLSEPCDSPKNINNLINHLLRLRNDLTAINPNIKLIILVYYENSDILKSLKNEKNIIIYSLPERFGDVRQEKYENETKHPSSLLWKEFTPVFVKDLNL